MTILPRAITAVNQYSSQKLLDGIGEFFCACNPFPNLK